MANAFERMAGRMDAVTIKVMGKMANINGINYAVVPAELLEEMGPLSGTGTTLVVFSSDYHARRNDVVIFDGESLTVTRHDKFNGKSRIHIE